MFLVHFAQIIFIVLSFSFSRHFEVLNKNVVKAFFLKKCFGILTEGRGLAISPQTSEMATFAIKAEVLATLLEVVLKKVKPRLSSSRSTFKDWEPLR